MHPYDEKQAKTLEGFLIKYFGEDQGVRFGESSVISTKVHANDEKNPGEIRIISDLDAGQFYLNAAEPGKYQHIDVFHQHANIDPVILGRKIWEGIKEYFGPLEKVSGDLTEEDWVKIKINFARQILVTTSKGTGNVYDLASNRWQNSSQGIENHVHILTQIPTGYFDYVVNLVDAVETSIIRQSYEIRKVERIVHCTQQVEDNPALTIPAPRQLTDWIMKFFKSNRNSQAIIRLATSLGSIEDAAQFLETMTPTKNIYLGKYFRKHDDLAHTIQDLMEKKLVKKTAFFYTLTAEGKEVKDYLRSHQKELEYQLRKAIRKRPSVSPQYSCLYNSRLKAKKRRLPNKRKIIIPRNEAWLSDVAIPETVVQAATRTYLQGSPRITIQKEDVRVLDRKSYAPVDTCLLIDGSGSMVGEKIRAVSYLAEHLLLTTRERVAVVTFQEMSAQTVVPFTRNYEKLQAGLSKVIPDGLTPMAKGILEALAEIKRNKARNPLLVLITDGVPNFPHWTTDAQQDALSAAKEIAQAKIRFSCIGLTTDERFLKELVDAGKGNLFLLANLERNQLVDIVTDEWKHY